MLAQEGFANEGENSKKFNLGGFRIYHVKKFLSQEKRKKG